MGVNWLKCEILGLSWWEAVRTPERESLEAQLHALVVRVIRIVVLVLPAPRRTLSVPPAGIVRLVDPV